MKTNIIKMYRENAQYSFRQNIETIKGNGKMKRLIAIDSESALNDCIEGINIKSLICAEIGNGNLTSDLSGNEIMDILKKRAEKIYFNPKINELSTDEKEKERLHILAEKQLEEYLKENDKRMMKIFEAFLKEV